jgi:ParB family chromosome partitioning protein
MEQKRKALGKGLEQLFNNEAFNIDEFEKSIVETTSKEDVVQINLSELRSNPYQPRKVFDAEKLDELTASIKEYGIIEPIIVKKSIKGYEIVAGERRSLAARKAGLDTIPAIVREFSDEEMMSIAILENVQREDLNIIEEANAYKNMIEVMHLTQDELAKKVGKSRSHITNILGILNLPKIVQDKVMSNEISMGHARALSKLEDENQIFDMTDAVIKSNMSVRQLEDTISVGEFAKKNVVNRKEVKDPKHLQVQRVMREKIGTLVKVNNKNIVIPFDSDKDLERILEILNIDINLD